MGRRGVRVKTFWWDGLNLLTPEAMDAEINKFLEDTPEIVANDSVSPEFVWYEIGRYLVCYLSYQINVPQKGSKQVKRKRK